MNITSPITTPVPQLPVQLDVTPAPAPQPLMAGWGEPMHPLEPEPGTQLSEPEADQTPKVRVKRGIFGRRFGGGSRPTPPVSPPPSPRVPPAPVSPTPTRPQTATGGKKPTTTHDTSGTSVTAGSSGQSTASRLKDALTKGPQTPPLGGTTPVKPAESPKVSVADVTQRLLDADRLVKAGVISTSPSTGKMVKDAFINAGINGMVSAPINVGAYAGSVAAGEAIKGQYVPSPVPPPPPHLPGGVQAGQKPAPPVVTPSTPDEPAPGATRHLDRVEKVLLEFANLIITLAGNTGDRLVMDDAWPKERGARMSNLEQLLDVSETHMKQIAEDNELIFKPHIESQTSPGTGGRLGVIERRYHALKKTADRIMTLKGAELNNAGTTV